jgi:Lipocalin-like domain
MTRVIFFALTALIVSTPSLAASETLEGTWKLISSQRTNQATGATTDTLGPNPHGLIMYGRDGHMIVLIAQSGRPRADSVEKISDQQRERLFSTMMAYAGTYTFDGKTIEHHIDLSWNEVWSETIQVRDIRKEGNRLIYTTRPAPSPVDGTMGVATVIWEKIN